MPRESAASAPVRIVIADDHPIFRDGLRRLLDTETGLHVVGEATDGVEAVRITRTLAPDVLLLDVAMPRMGGIESLAELQGCPARVIILTAAITEAAAVRALQLGARGIILKEAATRYLLDGIRRVVAGSFVLGEGVVDDVVSAISRVDSERAARRFNLTLREREIVQAIAAGQSNKDIADRLHISSQTVKHHLTSIFDKTGVSTRLELGMFAVRHRLADDE
jgi:two-component system, NarL family, nitrate/nitrite response regulator NarL